VKVTDLKALHEKLVLNAVRESGETTRSEVSTATGLSYPTVAALVQTLIAQGLVHELDRPHATGGRPSGVLAFDPTARFVVGIDLSEDRIRTSLVDLNGGFIADPQEGRPVQAWAGLATAIIEAVEQQLRARPDYPLDKLFSIGVGVRGSFEPHEGLVYLSHDETPVRLERSLQQRFGVPVLVDHNYNAALLGEAEFGVARGVRSAVFVNAGIGLGSALMFDGRIYQGFSGNAGELGHMCVEPDGERCPDCGRHGCLELYASAPAILRSISSNDHGSTGAAPDTERRIRHLLEHAETGDVVAREALKPAARYIAIAFANLINILEPEMAILGGPVGGRSKYLFHQVRTRVQHYAWPHSMRFVRLVQATSSDDGALRGAASLAIRARLSPEAAVPLAGRY
jgi:predicted NBD/HSP70 family sugar kinase